MKQMTRRSEREIEKQKTDEINDGAQEEPETRETEGKRRETDTSRGGKDEDEMRKSYENGRDRDCPGIIPHREGIHEGLSHGSDIMNKRRVS